MGIWLWPRIRNTVWGNWGNQPAADPPRLETMRYDTHPTQGTDSSLGARIDRFLPPSAGQGLHDLIVAYAQTPIEFPNLKGITIAQWAYESAWGNSPLCRRANNFGGMKWSPRDARFGGEPEQRTGFDGYEHNVRYTKFPNYASYIGAYWGRLDAVSAYAGWRHHTESPEAFFRSIGPPWVGYEANRYVAAVLGIYNRHIKYIIA